MKITVLSAVLFMLLTDVLEEHTAPSSGQQDVRPFWGTSLQPQLRMFITRPSTFKIDAKELLSTNGTTYKLAFKLSLTLNCLMYSDCLIKCK